MKNGLHHLSLLLMTALVALMAVGLTAWRSSGLRVYSMASDDLTPILQRGDLLLVAPDYQPHAGQVVNLADPANPRGVITQEFSSAGSGSLVGVTIKAVPLAGYVLEQLRRPAVLALTVYTPAVIIVYRQGRQMGRQLKRRPTSAILTPVASVRAL